MTWALLHYRIMGGVGIETQTSYHILHSTDSTADKIVRHKSPSVKVGKKVIFKRGCQSSCPTEISTTNKVIMQNYSETPKDFRKHTFYMKQTKAAYRRVCSNCC